MFYPSLDSLVIIERAVDIANDAVSGLVGGGTVATLAGFFFYMWRSDRNREIEAMKEEKKVALEQAKEEKEAEISRWQIQVDQYDRITQDLISCRAAENASREHLSENLGKLSESIARCNSSGNNISVK